MTNKTWVHLRTHFKDRWTARMQYQGDTPHNHGFESAFRTEEDSGKHRLASNLREVAVVATDDKKHIQQMTTQNDDILKVVRKQQDQTEKQQTQIDELMKHNGELINNLGNNINTGDQTSVGAEMPTGVGIKETSITPATATPTAMKQDPAMQLPPAPEQAIAPSAPFPPLVTYNG